MHVVRERARLLRDRARALRQVDAKLWGKVQLAFGPVQVTWLHRVLCDTDCHRLYEWGGELTYQLPLITDLSIDSTPSQCDAVKAMSSSAQLIKKQISCFDCGIESPEIETNYTLIGAKHGWRVIRNTDKSGKTVMEWRCPQCWAKHKSLPAAKK